MSNPIQTPADPSTAPGGSERWFVDEVHAHQGQLKAYLYRSFPSVRDVEDIVQESFLRVWTARLGQPIESSKAFLFRVARNVALDLVRKNRNSPFDYGRDLSVTRVLDNGTDARSALITKELLDHLADVLVDLPERWRQVLVLHKLKGMSQKEVASLIGLSERTVEKYCLKGVVRCEELLRARGIEGFLK